MEPFSPSRALLQRSAKACGLVGVLIFIGLSRGEGRQPGAESPSGKTPERRAAGKPSGVKSGTVAAASFSPDGKLVVTASEAKTARIWDAKTGRPRFKLTGHDGAVLAACFSSDGKRVVTASEDKTAKIWNADTGTEMLLMKGHTGSVLAASFSPDGKLVVTASEDKTARIWDAQTARERYVLAGHAGAVFAASFSSDGKRVVTTSEDRTARIWDAETGTEVLTLKGEDSKALTRAEADAPIDRVGIAESGYLQAMKAFLAKNTKVNTERNVTITISANPAVYEYRMALILADLEKLGLNGQALEDKLRSAAVQDDLKDYRGKVGFEVKVETSPTTVKLGGPPGEERELTRETYVLFTKRDLDDHVLLEQQKRQKACAVVGQDLKVKLERWQVWQGTSKSRTFRGLCATKKFKFEVTSSSLEVDSRAPVRLSMRDVLIQGEGLHSDDSINLKARQLSTRHFNELYAKDLYVEFQPAEWAEMPRPPAGFTMLLERVDPQGYAKR